MVVIRKAERKQLTLVNQYCRTRITSDCISLHHAFFSGTLPYSRLQYLHGKSYIAAWSYECRDTLDRKWKYLNACVNKHTCIHSFTAIHNYMIVKLPPAANVFLCLSSLFCMPGPSHFISIKWWNIYTWQDEFCFCPSLCSAGPFDFTRTFLLISPYGVLGTWNLCTMHLQNKIQWQERILLLLHTVPKLH